jgi:hypothetical protein
MADQKHTTNFYENMGGVNNKSSEYSVEKAQFLYLYNLDFDVPNALQKRPGSTQSIGANTSGPINSLFEFVKLTGESYVIAGTDTAMFYKSGTSLTVLDPGWNNGQSTDMLTFVNKLWMANGQYFKSWSGLGATAQTAGLPCSYNSATFFKLSSGATGWLVGGATMGAVLGGAAGSYLLRGVYVAYSYVRQDGYYGPADILSSARNIISAGRIFTEGGEWFDDIPLTHGFTAPASGISAIAVWVGVDSIAQASTNYENIPGIGRKQVGDLGWYTSTGVPIGQYMSVTLKPTANLGRFHLYTLLSPGTLISDTGSWAFTLRPNFNSYTGIATGGFAFTGMNFCWFDTNTPKYIEVNQNSMFMSGFSNAPSTIWFSELGTPESIEPENSFEVRTNDGDRIFGHKAFNNTVLVFKQNSFHKVIGDSPENYELVEMSGEYGCISDKTVVEYQEKLMWLDQKGVVEFNGVGWIIKSTPVEDMFRRMNLNAAKEKACAVHHLYRNQIWFGIPIDESTTNNLTVVYDYLVDAWTYFAGYNPASYAFVQSGLTKPTVWRGDYSGMIYYHGESFFGDNGQGITCLAMPHWDKHKENETWIWRRFFMDIATATGLTGQITGKLYSDYNQSTVMGTFAMYQNSFQSRAEVGVMGKAVTAEVAHYSASLPLLINGYSWAKRFLRNV